MGIFKRFLGAEPVAMVSDQVPDFTDGICVIASREPGGASRRLDRLYSREDATLVADELNREWPGSGYWAAPATTDELKAHPAQASRLMRSAREASY